MLSTLHMCVHAHGYFEVFSFKILITCVYKNMVPISMPLEFTLLVVLQPKVERLMDCETSFS